MSQRASARVIGLFVLGGLILAIGAILLFGSGALFKDTAEFISYFDANVSGLQQGAPVKFKGVEIGQVKDVRLGIEGQTIVDQDFRIPVIFELDRRRIRTLGSGNEDDTQTLEAAIDTLINRDGLRAVLTLESLVTGRQYIALDIYPESAIELEEATHDIQEIPSIQLEGFAELQTQLHELVAEIGQIRFDSVFIAATNTLKSIDSLVSMPQLAVLLDSLTITAGEMSATLRVAGETMLDLDSAVVPLQNQMEATSEAANRALDEAAAAATNLSNLLAPGSPVLVRLEQALADFSGATRALRALAEELERNPSAPVRGRPNDN